MSYLGSWNINEYLTLNCVTKRPDTGALNVADIVPQYLIYEDETTTPIVIGSYENFFSSNPAFYKKRIQLTTASGFNQGSTYTVYTSGQVSGVAGAKIDNFQINASVTTSGSSIANSDEIITAISGQIYSAFNDELLGTYISGSINEKMSNLATSTDLSSSVWDEILSSHSISGSAGDKLNGLAISGGATAQQVWEYATRTLTAFGFEVTIATNNDKTGYTLSVTPPTASEIRTEIDNNSTALQYISGQEVNLNNKLTTTRANYLDNLSAGAIALQSTVEALNNISVNDVASAVWDATIANYLSSGSAGEKLNSLSSGGANLTASDIWDYSARTLTAFGFEVTVAANNDKTGYTLNVTPPTATEVRQEIDSNSTQFNYISGSAETLLNRLSALRATYIDNLSSGAVALQATLEALNDPSSADIADAVWDEQLSGHSIAGSTGQKLSTVSSSGSAGDSWATLIPGEYTEGTAGKIVGDYLNAAITSRSSHSATDVRQEIDSNSIQLAYISGEASKLSNSIYGLATIHSLVDDLENRLTETRASYLDELGPTNIPSDIDILISRLTALRASYLDYLSGGAVATHQDALNIISDISEISIPSGGATLENQTAMLEDLTEIKGSGFTSSNSLKSITDYVSGGVSVDVNSIWEVNTSTIEDADAIGNKIERLVKPIVRY